MKSTIVDPFNDFDSAGYLRNNSKERDLLIIKHTEHNLFKANLDCALDDLSSRRSLTYQDFLDVHHKLFFDYYPWAGQDRSVTLKNSAVLKGGVLFCHPGDIRRAIEHGLRMGQDIQLMNKKPGEVMGLFAYGHPFLDGNGRTMLLVHMELAYRAGFSIAWAKTSKSDYLDALSKEIERPGKGILDDYLQPFKGQRLDRNEWAGDILSIKGLDGLDEGHQIDGYLTDPVIAEKYRKF